MTRSLGHFGIVAAGLAVTLLLAEATPASAQCCGAPAPTVAFSPVVQPTVVQPTIVRTGWYPGYLFDRMRLRRWSAADATPAVAVAPTYSVGYAPAYTASYAPTYTAAYAPATTYTAAYTPHITAYAPLQQPVVQTSYYAPAVTAAPACSSCAQTTTVSYAPSTVYRPVEVAPVVQTVVAAPACSTCSVETPCNACSACTGGTVSQATYIQSSATTAPADCPSCAASAGAPVYNYSNTTPPAAPAQSGPSTPQPQLEGNVPTPADPTYGTQRPTSNGTTGTGAAQENSAIAPSPAPDDATGPEADPATAPASDSSTFYDFQAPPLVAPQNDRTANRPTVDVHNAVYRPAARTAAPVSTTGAKAPAVDANGWYAVGN